jgi:hypothetical protein
MLVLVRLRISFAPPWAIIHSNASYIPIRYKFPTIVRSLALLSIFESHLHVQSVHALTLRGSVTPWLLQRHGARVRATILLVSPTRVLPFRSAHKLARWKGGKESRSQDHHASFKDHERDLVVR